MSKIPNIGEGREGQADKPRALHTKYVHDSYKSETFCPIISPRTTIIHSRRTKRPLRNSRDVLVSPAYEIFRRRSESVTECGERIDVRDGSDRTDADGQSQIPRESAGVRYRSASEFETVFV